MRNPFEQNIFEMMCNPEISKQISLINSIANKVNRIQQECGIYPDYILKILFMTKYPLFHVKPFFTFRNEFNLIVDSFVEENKLYVIPICAKNVPFYDENGIMSFRDKPLSSIDYSSMAYEKDKYDMPSKIAEVMRGCMSARYRCYFPELLLIIDLN